MTTAFEYWGAKAEEYDSFIRRVVPRYDEQMTRLLESMPPRPGQVLELGCGTGNLSARLARLTPDASFTFVDAAPEMLEITRARLMETAPEVASRSRFLAMRFEDLEPDPTPGDLVVASLSLHHVPDLEPVYRTIRGWLRRGGSFRCSDGFRGAAAPLHELHMARWAAFWQEPGNLSADEIVSVSDHVERHDHYRPLEEHFRMLEGAGFVLADCIWRDGLFAILSAEVP